MSNGNQEIDNLMGSILGLAGAFLKSLAKGIWRGLRKLNTLKKVLWFLPSLLLPVGAVLGKDILFSLFPQEMPGYIRQIVYFSLLVFPLLLLWALGQSGKRDNYEDRFAEIAFKGKDGKYPVFCGKSKEGRKIILLFQSTVPLSDWKASRERLETALDCNIYKIENGKNKRLVKLTTLPSDYQIPAMVEWKEEYLNNKRGVLSVGISAIHKVQFDLNRVPHVLVAGETGSGKSVILRCLLWQMILQGARVYMIDFKGGVEFGKQYEKYGEVITQRERALEVFEFLVKENDYRLRIFRDLEVKNLDEYNRKTRQNLSRIGVFTDELAEMLDKKGIAKEEKALYEQIEGRLSTLARLSRATGINLFMGVQRPDANVLTGQIKNNIPVRISGRFADKTASEIVLGNTDAVNLPDIKGRFLYKVGNETIEFQSFFFDDEKMLREVYIEQGDMLTEVPVYGYMSEKANTGKGQPERKAGEEADKKRTFSPRKEKTQVIRELQGNTQEDYLADLDQKELEAKIRQMDEEDLNLNFGDF